MHKELHPGVWPLSFFWEKTQSNVLAYLIKGKLPTIIDTGPPQASPETIISLLKTLDLKLSDLELILHTHGHIDHRGGDVFIKESGEAQILLHQGDIVFFNNHVQCFDQFNAPFLKKLGREKDLEDEKAVFLKENKPQMAVDRQLDDNDSIELGNGVQLRVVHLPGHTPGSVGYYWEREGLLFIGDSVSGLHSPGGSLPVIFDFDAYVKSIDRLFEMDFQMLLCCHNYRGVSLPPSYVRHGQEIKQFLCDSRDVADRIRDAVYHHASQRKGGSLFDITDDVIAKLPEKFGFKRIAELQSPLFSLRTVFWCLSGIK